MRAFLTIAILTTAVVATAQSASASLTRPNLGVAATAGRIDRDICRTDLRSAACAVYQKRLLNAVLQDARSSDAPTTTQQVTNRQLNVLIASVG